MANESMWAVKLHFGTWILSATKKGVRFACSSKTAKKFKTETEAECALRKARTFFGLRDAEVVQIETEEPKNG